MSTVGCAARAARANVDDRATGIARGRRRVERVERATGSPCRCSRTSATRAVSAASRRSVERLAPRGHDARATRRRRRSPVEPEAVGAAPPRPATTRWPRRRARSGPRAPSASWRARRRRRRSSSTSRRLADAGLADDGSTSARARCRPRSSIARCAAAPSSASRPTSGTSRLAAAEPGGASRRRPRATPRPRSLAARGRETPERLVADDVRRDARRWPRRRAPRPGGASVCSRGGGVDDVAHRRVVAAGERADEHLAGVDRRCACGCSVRRGRSRARQLARACACIRSAGAHGPLGVVLVGDRRAEQGDDRVADDLVDPPPKAAMSATRRSKQRSTRRFTCSGSSVSASAVKPTRSANSTVTTRRSSSERSDAARARRTGRSGRLRAPTATHDGHAIRARA